MKKIPTISIIIVIILLLVGAYFFGYGKGKEPILSAELVKPVVCTPCTTLSQQIKDNNNCPEPEIIINMGYVSGDFKTDEKVKEIRIDGEQIIKKKNPLTKDYEEVKTLTEFNSLTK